ncbi:hypothetical protein WDZ92_27440 [Nostoc sp. NIES-2111]
MPGEIRRALLTLGAVHSRPGRTRLAFPPLLFDNRLRYCCCLFIPGIQA